MSRSLASWAGAARIVSSGYWAGRRGHRGGLKAQARGLGGHLGVWGGGGGGISGPVWNSFGATSGIREAMLDDVGLGRRRGGVRIVVCDVFGRARRPLRRLSGPHPRILEAIFGCLGGHSEAMVEVLKASLVDSLGVIEADACQGR